MLFLLYVNYQGYLLFLVNKISKDLLDTCISPPWQYTCWWLYDFLWFYSQKDLDMLAAMWNTHTLSSRSSILHEGNRPLMLYTLPELYGYENQLCTVNAHEVLLCEEETTPRPEHPCDETVKELCYDIMNETSNIMPEDAGSAKDLYLSLRTAILSQL